MANSNDSDTPHSIWSLWRKGWVRDVYVYVKAIQLAHTKPWTNAPLQDASNYPDSHCCDEGESFPRDIHNLIQAAQSTKKTITVMYDKCWYEVMSSTSLLQKISFERKEVTNLSLHNHICTLTYTMCTIHTAWNIWTISVECVSECVCVCSAGGPYRSRRREDTYASSVMTHEEIR